LGGARHLFIHFRSFRSGWLDLFMDRSVKKWTYTWLVAGAGSINAQVRKSGVSRTGVYLLTFANGQRYVGKATNVAGRFAHHAATWSDIETVRFSPVPAEDLDEYERGTIRLYEGPGRLRNKLLTGYWYGFSPLDDVVPSSVQEAWWRDLVTAPEELVARRTDGVMAGVNHARVRTRDDYDQLVALAASFVRAVIPRPATTCGEFWSAATRSGVNLVSVYCGGWELFALWQEEGRREIVVRGCFAGAELTRDASWLRWLNYAAKAGIPVAREARSGMLLEDVFFNDHKQLVRRLSNSAVLRQARLAAIGQMRTARKAPRDTDPILMADVLAAVYASGN
jgi:hypothetical protein